MELELLDSILPSLRQNSTVITGPGDDCAVVEFKGEKLLLAADQVTENIHFTSQTAPERAGAKLVKRNLSDIAAMGGYPLWMMLAVSNGSRDMEWVKRFVSGAEKAAELFDVPIVGGDTSSLPAEGFTASVNIAPIKTINKLGPNPDIEKIISFHLLFNVTYFFFTTLSIFSPNPFYY